MIEFIEYVRKQFPALETSVNGIPAAFLDGPGGYQVPACITDAVEDYLINRNANVGGTFLASRRTDATLQSARKAFADFFNCTSEEVAFGARMQWERIGIAPYNTKDELDRVIDALKQI